eukprot:5872808-Prorocentrum_lima.AAC.1
MRGRLSPKLYKELQTPFRNQGLERGKTRRTQDSGIWDVGIRKLRPCRRAQSKGQNKRSVEKLPVIGAEWRPRLRTV